MNHDDITKTQEVASRLDRDHLSHVMDETLDAKMKELRQKEKEEDELFLKELSDEDREEIFMVLQ